MIDDTEDELLGIPQFLKRDPANPLPQPQGPKKDFSMMRVKSPKPDEDDELLEDDLESEEVNDAEVEDDDEVETSAKPEDDEVEEEAETEVEKPKARRGRPPKAANEAMPKAAKAAVKPAKAPAKAVKAKANGAVKKAKPAAEKDVWGYRKGSTKSQAAAMYALKRGATLAEVKEKLGSVQLNVLVELEGKGHTVRRIKEKGTGARQITRYFLSD